MAISLFTSLTEDLNSGRPRTNLPSGQSGTGTEWDDREQIYQVVRVGLELETAQVVSSTRTSCSLYERFVTTLKTAV